MFFGHCQLGICLFLLLGHGWRDILEGRANIGPLDLKGRVEVGGWNIILLVFLDGGVRGGCIFALNLYIKIANAVAHDVQHLLVL